MGLGITAGAMGNFPAAPKQSAQIYSKATNGLPPLKTTNVKAIATAPRGTKLIMVKVETSEPDLYGVGCATFHQRARSVLSAIDDYLADFCVGMSVDNT